MSVNGKSDICNLGLSTLGNYGTVSDIDTPTNDKEITFAQWYDICRQFTLKLMMPNFALGRENVAKLVDVPPFGYSFYYATPTNCLKVLGIGLVKEKKNNYAVEGNKILTNESFDSGMPVRFIKDITDVNQFSPEYILLLSDYLAAYTCMAVTQDAGKAKEMKAALPAEINIASGLNAQENMPIRINNSKYRDSRFNGSPDRTDKS